MPLLLNVGVNRKVGLPDYGSAGASCNIQLELDPRLLEGDLDAFHERVRSAYVAARQAVHDELARLKGPPGAPGALAHAAPPPADGRTAGWPASHDGDGAVADRPRRPATPNQCRAVRALARRADADLAGLLREGFGVGRPEELSVGEASSLIDRLKCSADV